MTIEISELPDFPRARRYLSLLLSVMIELPDFFLIIPCRQSQWSFAEPGCHPAI
jgi:hypothetical protein